MSVIQEETPPTSNLVDSSQPAQQAEPPPPPPSPPSTPLPTPTPTPTPPTPTPPAKMKTNKKTKTKAKAKKEKARRYRGTESKVKIPSGSVGQHLLMTIRSFGNNRALVEASDPELSMSFRTVINQVKACAIGLLFCGMSDKSVILLALPSIPHVPIIALAITLIGGTCVLVDPTILKGSGVAAAAARLQQDTGATALIGTNHLIEQHVSLHHTFQLTVTISLSDDADTAPESMSSSNPKHQLHSYDELLALGRANSKKVPPPAQVNGTTSIAFMVPTQRCHASLDRLVGLTHQAVVSMLVGIVNAKEFTADDVLAVALPFWDARALFGAVLPALLSGACVVCPGATVDPATLLMFLTDHEVTQLWTNVKSIRYVARHHAITCEAPLGAMLPKLKCVCSIEAVSSHVMQQCVDACSGKIQVYVNNCPAELGGRVCSAALMNTKPGDIYRTLPLLPGIECKILHPASRKMCAPGKRGLVCLKGTSMMAGKEYSTNPDSNCS